MTTTVVYGDTADNHVNSQNATWSTARTGAGTLALGTATSTGHTPQANQAPPYDVREMFIGFDTSAIPDADTVSAATLVLWIVSMATWDGASELRARLKDWGATVDTGDFVDNSAPTTLLASIGSGSVTTGALNTLTSDAAFKNNINKTGYTRMYLTHSISEQSTPSPTTGGFNQYAIHSADYAGTTRDPELTVVHAAAAAAATKMHSYRQRRI